MKARKTSGHIGTSGSRAWPGRSEGAFKKSVRVLKMPVSAIGFFACGEKTAARSAAKFCIAIPTSIPHIV